MTEGSHMLTQHKHELYNDQNERKFMPGWHNNSKGHPLPEDIFQNRADKHFAVGYKESHALGWWMDQNIPKTSVMSKVLYFYNSPRLGAFLLRPPYLLLDASLLWFSEV